MLQLVIKLRSKDMAEMSKNKVKGREEGRKGRTEGGRRKMWKGGRNGKKGKKEEREKRKGGRK